MARTTIAGIAEQAGIPWDTLLDFNPAQVPFDFPPEFAKGLEIAESLGVQVPQPGQVIQDILGPIRNQIETLGNTEIPQGELLSRIEWLF
jgi:hypothetical protein